MHAFDYGLADLHIHSRFSDGVSTIRQILDHIERERFLDVIAITDHNTIKGALLAASLQERYTFDIVVGEEITTESGEIIGLFLQDEIERDLSAEKTVALIHEQGGLAIAPHPFALRVGGIGGTGIRTKGVRDLPLDGYEEFNANPTTFYSNILSRWRLKNITGVAKLGGSDAHTARSVGAGATVFKGKSAQDLRRGVERCETVPVKTSSWLKEFLISTGVTPGMAAQVRKLRNGTAVKAATKVFLEEAARLGLPRSKTRPNPR